MSDPATAAFISLTLPQLITLVVGVITTVIGGGTVGYKTLSNKSTTIEVPSPACPLNGRLSVVADNYKEMNENLRELKDAMIEFTAGVRHEHCEHSEAHREQAVILREASNILAVISSHVAK